MRRREICAKISEYRSKKCWDSLAERSFRYTRGRRVVENNGLGFELAVSSNTLDSLKIGLRTLSCLSYLQLREDGLTLFGFATVEEKEMFLKLISVSGIGPKVALSVMSGLKMSDLSSAIVTGDIALLTSVKGLGKKTAERIVLELKDKVDVSREAFVNVSPAAKGSLLSSEANEAVSVLVSLGLSRQDAAARIKNASENGAETTEELLSYALKNS